MKKKDYNDIIEDMRKRKVVSIMGRQVVFVGGKRFTIITDESEEYMKNIVERLDTRLRSIISTNPKLDKDSAALWLLLITVMKNTKSRRNWMKTRTR